MATAIHPKVRERWLHHKKLTRYSAADLEMVNGERRRIFAHRCTNYFDSRAAPINTLSTCSLYTLPSLFVIGRLSFLGLIMYARMTPQEKAPCRAHCGEKKTVEQSLADASLNLQPSNVAISAKFCLLT